jgi:hypothetical protein
MNDPSPPERERARLTDGPKLEKQTYQPSPSQLETFIGRLIWIEDQLAELALGDPDRFGELLRPAVQIRAARRHIANFVRASRQGGG